MKVNVRKNKELFREILVIYVKKIKKYSMENVYQNVARMKYTFSVDVNAKKVFNRLMENV